MVGTDIWFAKGEMAIGCQQFICAAINAMPLAMQQCKRLAGRHRPA
jgi:hypothetical protein